MAHPNTQLPGEYKMETIDKAPMEDKIIMSREEDFQVKELTPGEISHIVNNALRDLPHPSEIDGEVEEVCLDVAYAVMCKMLE
jgi:hypothetical protein